MRKQKNRLNIALIPAALALTGLLIAGCDMGGSSHTEGSRTYTPVGHFALAGKRPRLGMYPEFANPAANRYATQEAFEGRLQPLPSLSGGPAGMRPVSVQSSHGGMTAPGVKPLPPHMVPNGMQPMQQLIYGGSFPHHDVGGDVTFSPRDKLKVIVRDHPEFSGTLEVNQEGYIQLPNAEGLIMAMGLTTRQVETAIASYVAPFLRDRPTVKVTAQFVMGGYYYIFGEVRNQGRFPLGVTPMRLSEAVFRANSRRVTYRAEESREERLRDETEITPRQGFSLSKYADLRRVSVITPHRVAPSRLVYNVKKAIYGGQVGNDPVIQPGQILFIPSSVDKKIIDFAGRVVAPLSAVRSATGEVDEWYGITTGNTTVFDEEKD